MSEHPLLTVQEAAALLGVHHNTIRNAINDGRLPAYRLERRLRLKHEDVLALLTPVVPSGQAPTGGAR